jgi:hypothetical protein
LQFDDIAYNDKGKEQCVRCLEECKLLCRYCTELRDNGTVWVPISKLTSHASECASYNGSNTYKKYGEQPPVLTSLMTPPKQHKSSIPNSGPPNQELEMRKAILHQKTKRNKLKAHRLVFDDEIESDERNKGHTATIPIWDIHNGEFKVLGGHADSIR